MPHRPRFVPEEELLDQSADLLIADLLSMDLLNKDLLITDPLTVNRRQRGCRAPELRANWSDARRLSFGWYFGKKLTEHIHWTTTLPRSIREIEGIACSGAGSQASTGTSSRP